MKVNLLYPSDYFDIKEVEQCYEEEYKAACKIPQFDIIRYDYDAFMLSGELKTYPKNLSHGFCIYRGWMLKPKKYRELYERLYHRGVLLINNPDEYDRCHLFPNIYKDIEGYTPKAIWYQQNEEIDWNRVNKEFTKFMIKDYVKSVKGADFPSFFMTPVKKEAMKDYINQFIQLREPLFTKGIVIKEFVDLKRYLDITNEYRVFYLKGQVLTLSKNSNQVDDCPEVPAKFVEKFRGLKSNFYTVDYAELTDGKWIVIETGDGQVSGLSPNQCISHFYDRLCSILSAK
jgi:hypothetical protein